MAQQEYQKIWDNQQKLMNSWLDMMWKNFQPGFPYVKTAGAEKEETVVPPAATGWAKAVPDLFGQWARTQNQVFQKWMDVFRIGADSSRPEMYLGGIDAFKFWKDGLKTWGDWIEDAGKNLPGLRGESLPIGRAWFIRAWVELMTGYYHFWRTQLQSMKNAGVDPGFLAEGVFSEPPGYREFMETWIKNFPIRNWSIFLRQSDEVLDEFIDFLKDIDLPFDEMASFWDRLMMQFTPMDEVPFFKLGSDIYHYVEEMVNPFEAIVGPPRMLRSLKQLRVIQFYYLSYLLKTIELRGLVLEASLAAWPESLKSLNLEFEETQQSPDLSALSTIYLNKLESHLQKVLESEAYARLQKEVAQTGVTLKAKIDEMMELAFSGLPVMTKTDMDDVSREIEALRVKLRKLSREKKHREKAVASEMN